MLETCDLYTGVGLYKPMLVHKTPDNASALMKSGDYMAQKKKDGYWYQLVKTKDGEIYLFSRSKSKKTGFYSEKIDNVPHIKEWAQNLPNDTILVGEIYYPGKTSKDTTTIMGCLPEKAVIRQQGTYGWIHYYIHDILRYDGYDYVQQEIDFAHRYCDLNNYSKKYNWEGANSAIEVAYMIADLDMEDIIASWMECGEEGAVVRLASGLYLPGKRRKEMWKIKQHEDNLDFVITGFVDPEEEYTGKEIDTWPYWKELDNGKLHYLLDGIRIKTLCKPVTKAYYNNWKMGFTIGLYNGNHIQEIGKVTSGLDDAMRQDIAEHPEKYMGQCIRVSAMSVDKEKLSIRHPVFVSIHFDKPASDCRLEDVFKF